MIGFSEKKELRLHITSQKILHLTAAQLFFFWSPLALWRWHWPWAADAGALQCFFWGGVYGVCRENATCPTTNPKADLPYTQDGQAVTSKTIWQYKTLSYAELPSFLNHGTIALFKKTNKHRHIIYCFRKTQRPWLHLSLWSPWVPKRPVCRWRSLRWDDHDLIHSEPERQTEMNQWIHPKLL